MKKVRAVFVAVFFAFIGLIGIMTVFNSREVSDLEARTLQKFVKPDASSVMDGSFSKLTDTAFSDQLEFRDFFVKTYYKVTFQRYNGDVAKGSDNQLFSSCQDAPDKAKTDKALKNITVEMNRIADSLAKDGRKFIFVSIPRKDAVMTGFLPSTYTSSDEIYKHSMEVLESELNENVIVIDAYDLFSEADKKGQHCYFTTDHHVNLTGGMLIHDEISRVIKEDYPEIEFTGRDDYNVEKVIVNGSFNRLIGQSVKSEPEELNISLKKTDFTYTRTDKGVASNQKIWGSGSTYSSAYMSGDNPETVVTTSNTDCPRVLITGSSFTNLLEVLLIPDCSVLASVDYRSNNSGKDLLTYAKELDAQYVVYIPSQSNNAHSIKNMKVHLGLYAGE